jgi:hypothetical protein
MRTCRSLCLFLILFLLAACSQDQPKQQPLSLNSYNPHYFTFRGRPEVLIGSTEHYGAVMNLDFDYIKYLDELDSCGLNITRTFSGSYVEPENAFGILKNTLAPAPGRYICPWARSSEPGYANGGNKFDLSRWDENYFLRLKDFVAQAGKRGIIVELDLFSNYYDTLKWNICPMNIRNNINGIGDYSDHNAVLSTDHADLMEVEEKMVRKIVNELKDFDNIYYEVCNEPYFGDTTALAKWEKFMTAVVADAEKDFTFRHLISNNIANYNKLVPSVRPDVSVYNFHYAHPPVAVGVNYHLDKVIGDNETGFNGTGDANYRTEAWNFMLAGGGLFNNLDYSFTAGNEDGSFVVQEGEPGGGGKTLRKQLRILSDFMHSIDFINMKPADSIRMSADDDEATVRALSDDAANLIAVYVQRKDTVTSAMDLQVDLSPGSYSMIWTDTKTGKETDGDIKYHQGGFATLTSPVFSEDIALRIAKAD